MVAHGFTAARAADAGLGGPARRDPDRVRDLPGDEGVQHGELIFQVAFFVVLLSTILQGLTIEPVARWLGVTTDEAAIPAPLVEPVLLNRLGAETMQFPVRDERRDQRPSGARARAAARGAAERDRARRARDPAARLDDHPGRRPAARARPPGGRGRVPRADAALAHRAGRTRGASAPAAPQPPVGHLDPPLAARRRRPAAPEGRSPATTSSSSCARAATSRARSSLLEDGRFAVSGPLLAIGPSGELQAFARRRLANATSPGERAWWQEVVGALAR